MAIYAKALRTLKVVSAVSVIFSLTFSALYLPRYGLSRLYTKKCAHFQREYTEDRDWVSSWYGPGAFWAWFITAVVTVLQDALSGPIFSVERGTQDPDPERVASSAEEEAPVAEREQTNSLTWRNPNTLALLAYFLVAMIDVPLRSFDILPDAQYVAASAVERIALALAFTGLIVRQVGVEKDLECQPDELFRRWCWIWHFGAGTPVIQIWSSLPPTPWHGLPSFNQSAKYSLTMAIGTMVFWALGGWRLFIESRLWNSIGERIPEMPFLISWSIHILNWQVLMVGLLGFYHRDENFVCGISLLPKTNASIEELDQAGPLALAIIFAVTAVIPEKNVKWAQCWGAVRRAI